MKDSKKTPDDKDKKNGKNVTNNPDDENKQNENDKKKKNFKLIREITDGFKLITSELQGRKMKESKKTPDGVRNNPDDENDKKKWNPKDFINKSMNPKWKDFKMKIFPKKKKSQSNEMPPLLPGINPSDCTDIQMNILHKNEKSQSNEMPPLLPGINPPDCTVIEEYDERKTLLEETKELNAEMQEMYSGGSRDDERVNKVASGYRDLRRRVFQVINDFITNNDGNLLKLKDAIQAIEEEGREDRRQPWQPWKSELEECVALSVTERIITLPKYSSDAPGSHLSQVLAALGKAMKDDLKHVRENLIPHYPEECDVYYIYAQQYHLMIQNEISPFLEDELEINDIHCLLSWIHKLYPTILRDPTLTDQLGELLPAENIIYLEKMYINCQQGLVEIWMTNALELVEKCWKDGDDSELSVDIIQMYHSEIEAAKEISEDLVNKMTPVLVSEFLRFLKRYERSFKIHCENYEEKPRYKETIIANMICCCQFRDFIECANAKEDTKKEMYWIVSKIENQGVGILLQGLFPDIKSHFRAIRHKKGQYSQENMLQMFEIATTYMSNVTTPDNPCYQVMAGKVHMHLVQEYIATIIAISPCNKDEQKALATQMHNTADLLTDFCKDQLNDAQMSEATLVNNKIRKIATIIKLEDLEAIKLDVAVLIDEYSDITKKDVRDILKIKKNLNFFQRISVEKILDPPDRNLCPFLLCLLCPCLCPE